MFFNISTTVVMLKTTVDRTTGRSETWMINRFFSRDSHPMPSNAWPNLPSDGCRTECGFRSTGDG